ncbi:phosphatidylserine/phosphatidylglycerophosphate/cardiolipin synthase family protein [Nocardioides sp.]|uniref:phospholipase D-like domain-containing protein n=1 Tax=Nocardioides sp. TaxID=35761 RepID=UPI0035136D52
MRRVAVLPLLALMLTAAAVVPTGAAARPDRAPSVARAATPSGQPATTFNAPRPFGDAAANNRILVRVEQAINGVPGPTKKNPEPTITIASYLFDRAQSVDALIRACRRGVGVRVILDGDISTRAEKRLVSALNGDNVADKNKDGKPDGKAATGRCGRPKKEGRANRAAGLAKPGVGATGLPGLPELQVMTRRQAVASIDQPVDSSVTWGKDRSYVKRCSGSCRNLGDGGNMHSKFYLFSRTNGVDHVSMFSSSNLNRGGAVLGWNDLFVVEDRPRLYDFFLQVHRAMTRQLRADAKKLEFTDANVTARVYPLRGASKANDPTLADLKAIKCTSALGRTQINISMFYWQGDRGGYLADQVLALARQGCAVNIIYGAPSRIIAGRLRAAANSGLINLWDSRFDLNEDGFVDVRTHAKYVLVKGTFRGNDRAHVVLTGSQNWSKGSLTLGDDITLNIAGKSIYSQYLRHWNVVRSHSTRK